MDLGQDTHLCLRCGKTIDGLDNYVSHRQKKCFQQPPSSPCLTAASAEPPVQDFPSVSQDIYKLSANDFFLHLNLQHNTKPSCADVSGDDEKDSGITQLEMPSLENDLTSAFPGDKTLSYSTVEDENNCLDIGSMPLCNEKWENFKINNQLNEGNQLASKEKKVFDNVDQQTLNLLPPVSLKLKGTLFTDACEVSSKVSNKHSKKKALKKYYFTNFSTLNIPRTSYRQKLNANDRMLCCDGKQDYYFCLLCNLKYSFPSTFLDHLLICSKKQSGIEKWKQEVFKNGSLFVHSSQFKCLLCSFYCNDSFMFLNHLKTPNHRQKTASLKNPLICLPCQDECSASDEMREHFSKCHLQYKRGDHPIIITEKKRNLHCCYCLTLIKCSSHLQDSGNNESPLLKDEVSFIRISLPNVCACACGVDKQMLNDFFTYTSPFITSQSSEISKCLQIEGDVEHSSSPQSQKLNDLVTLEVDEQTDADTHLENDLSLKAVRQRIIAKITSKNGKFIYKKVRSPVSKKEWTCSWCGAEYISKLTLQAHLNKCNLRKEKLNKISPLKNNQNVQEKDYASDKKYLCDKCPYTGKSFNQLTRHSRSHSGEKPYKCPHCTYSSSLSSQLVRHKRLHTGKKPYKCPYCSYMCNTQENLRKHILKTKKHKGKMMYPCQHCSFESNEFSDFKSHLLEIHSIQFPNGITGSDSSTQSDENPGL